MLIYMSFWCWEIDLSGLPLQHVRKNTKTIMGEGSCFQKSAPQGDHLSMSGVTFGCSNLGGMLPASNE